jgi:hypothetical protein
MKAIVQFVPKHFEKAIDVARSVATFAQIEFKPGMLRVRITDPVKVLHMDLILTPDVFYKCESEFVFGVNLQMFYKLLKSLDNNDDVEIEADESVMKINQCQHHHTLINQEVTGTCDIDHVQGPKVILGTKLLQRYVRALSNAAPVVEIDYVPTADTLFMESVSSMYRTLFSLNTATSPNECEQYRKQFILKFLDTAINPSLADTVELTLGDSLVLHYANANVQVWITQAAYTEG